MIPRQRSGQELLAPSPAPHPRPHPRVRRRTDWARQEWLFLLGGDVLALAAVLLVVAPWPALAAVSTGLVVAWRLRLYRRRFTLAVLEDFWRLGGTALAATGAVAATAGLSTYSPLRWVTAGATMLAGLVLARAAAYLLVRRRRRRGVVEFPVLLLGAREDMIRLGRAIVAHPETGLRLVGYLDRALPAVDDPPGRLLGTVPHLRSLLREHPVSDVVLGPGLAKVSEVVDAVRSTSSEAAVHVLPSYHHVLPRRLADDQVWGLPLLTLSKAPHRSGTWRVKRALDVAAASVALLLVAPVMAAVALAVRIELGPGVIFRQQRVGLNGRAFDMFKFRSLRHAPPEGSTAQEWSRYHDDRIGVVGRVIRKYSLDELPQLVNVLRGDMSMVGPRPELPHFVDDFSARLPHYRHRHRVRAGVTGLAAVKGLRGDTDLHERVYFDNVYIDDWSLWNDVKILLATARAVLRGTGG